MEVDCGGIYKLRCSLLGHSMDVRGVVVGGGTEGGSEYILSGSRDRSAKVWVPSEEHIGFDQFQSCEGHTNFVSCVYVIPPNEKHPSGLILSGSHDHTILAFELGKHQPVFRLAGHKGTVCSISGTGDGLIVSGSWDQSAKVWSEQSNVATLVGHGAAVWAVATVPSSGTEHRILTGSADKDIRLWVNYQSTMVFKGHTDCVRALAVIDADRFLSGSNDAAIRLWSIGSGETLETFYGHTNFIYSISLLPQENSFVSVGEDRTLRIWKGSSTSQVIFHPATSVWSVATLKNGDIVTGSSDGTVRVFTSDIKRMGTPEVIAAFEEEVSKNVVAAQADLGGMKVSELPGPESLLTEGKEDGATIMVREGDKVGCYSWSVGEQKWTKVGDVVGASGATQSTSGKVLHEGKEYDYVFTVDLDAQGTLKLPYNINEDPWFAAQKFIHRHELSQLFLDQVANFIINNTKGMQISQGVPATDFVDPFTGASRYIPGSEGQILGGDRSNGGQNGGGLDPFTGSGAYTTSTPKPSSSVVDLNNGGGPCFPVKEFLQFTGPPNYAALKKKLVEFIGELGPEAGFGDEAIETLLDIGRKSSWNENAALLIKTCLVNWPAEKIFPVLDLLRLGVLNPTFASKLFETFGFILDFGTKYIQKETPTNQMLVLRLFCNSFGALTEPLMAAKHNIISQLLSNFAKSKTNEIAAATLILNYSMVLRDGKTAASLDGQTEMIMGAISLIELLEEPEAIYRLLVAVGNLVSGNETMAILFRNLSGDSMLNNFKENGASSKIKNCAIQIQTTISLVQGS